MIEVFYGDDRLRAKAEITKVLGENYEVLDGADLSPDDLPSVFLGVSLFASIRNILIRDFTSNRAVYDELPKYLNTPHKIILFETKLDKRAATYKLVRDKITFREFVLPENADFRLIFNIFKTAKLDGPKAIAMLAKIKTTEDPIKFTGLLVSQAIKDFTARQGSKEKNVLKELSILDLQMKTTKIDPWLLVESFLLRLSSLS